MSEKPPSNKELRADIAELSQKLGVEVTPATSNAALLEQRDGLRAQLAALEAGDGGGDKGAATTPPSGSPPADQPPPPSPAAPGFAVAPNRSLCAPRGILGPGERLRNDDAGPEALKRLKAKGVIVDA